MPGANAGAGINWPVLLSAISSMLPNLEGARIRSGQADDLMAGQQAMAGRQAGIDRAIGDEIGATVAETPEQQQTAALADYTAALQQARARGQASSVPASALGSEYAAGKKTADQGVVVRSSDRARQLATIQGSTRMREQAAQRRGRLQSEIETQQGHAGMDAFLAQLAARNRFANPYVGIVSELGQQIGANYDRGGAGKSGKPRGMQLKVSGPGTGAVGAK